MFIVCIRQISPVIACHRYFSLLKPLQVPSIKAKFSPSSRASLQEPSALCPGASGQPLLEGAKIFCSLNLPLPMEPKELFVPWPLECIIPYQQLTCTQLSPGRAHCSHLCSEHREEIFHSLMGYSVDWNGLNVLI